MPKMRQTEHGKKMPKIQHGMVMPQALQFVLF